MLIDRAQAAAAKANEALRLTGNEGSRKVARKYARCSPIEACLKRAESEPDKVGLYAGLAIHWSYSATPGMGALLVLSHEKQVEAAENAADRAMQEAGKAVAAHAEQQANLDAEHPNVTLYISMCQAEDGGCKTKCERGDQWACYGRAMHLWEQKPPKFAEAKTLMGTACSTGQIVSACVSMPRLEQEAGAYERKLSDLWSEVTNRADSIAFSKYEREKLYKYDAGSTSFARKLHDAIAYEQSMAEEHYCPAKRDFVAAAGAAEFTKRAAIYCKDTPSQGAAYSGGSVPIPNECREAFATACP